MKASFNSRKPWATVVVSLIFTPAIGMLYLGKGLLGIIYLIAVIPISAPLDIVLPEFEKDVIFSLIVIVGTIHCYFISRNLNQKMPRVWFARWYNIFGMFAGVSFFLIATRIFLWDWYSMAAGSMKPMMKAKDIIIVSKFSYGFSRHSLPFSLPLISERILFSEPERGDVIVFKLPSNNRTDYIKRVIGLPNDKIQMKNGRLFLNGTLIEREKIEDFIHADGVGRRRKPPSYIETLPNGNKYGVLEEWGDKGPLDNTGVYEVPTNHYFALGDNRDNSQDSRVHPQVGFIPKANLIGKVKFVISSSKQKK